MATTAMDLHSLHDPGERPVTLAHQRVKSGRRSVDPRSASHVANMSVRVPSSTAAAPIRARSSSSVIPSSSWRATWSEF